MYQLNWSSEFARCEIMELNGERWLVLRGRGNEYDPTSVRALPEALASVNRAKEGHSQDETQDPRERALLTFVDRYGCLGFTFLEGKPKLFKRKRERFLIDGDPLNWALAHAQNVDLILSLMGQLGAHAWGKLRSKEWPNWSLIQRIANSPIIPTTSPPWYAEVSSDARTAVERDSVAATARRLLSELLTPNLAGVTRVVDQTGQDFFHFPALISLIYWQIADRGRSTPLRQCQCGAWFFVTNDLQAFCPPLAGQKESQCAKRYRMRRLRKRGK